MELTAEDVAAALGERPHRFYPALLSTDADARAWARAGADEGSVVAAGYQASPRGRGGLEWHIGPSGLSFSLILRPRLPPHREGWLFVVAATALADVVGADATVEWPDEVRSGGTRAAAAGVHVELGEEATEWAVVTVLVEDAPDQPAAVVAEVVEAIERRYRSPTVAVLTDYLARCETIGRRVTARLAPMGPGGVTFTGRADKVLPDGALVVVTDKGTRIAIRPQNLGLLDPA